jgi:hypothetical protein
MAGPQDFSPLPSIQADSGVQPAPSSLNADISFAGVRHLLHGGDQARNGGPIPPLSHTPSWHGAQLINLWEDNIEMNIRGGLCRLSLNCSVWDPMACFCEHGNES